MKDFDFTPEPSTSDLTGYVLMPREIANLSIWKKRPFSAGQAVADLYFIANTAAGEFTPKKGGTVTYRAGWCIHSNRGLAERWGWRKDDVEPFLRKLETAEIIRRHETGQDWKAIELLDYHPIWDANGTPLGHKRDANGTPLGTEGSCRSIGDEGGEGEHAPEVSIPSIEDVRTWSELSGVDPDYAEVKWRTTSGNCAWQTRQGKVIDWRNLWLGFWLQDRGRWVLQKKNAGGNGHGPNGLPRERWQIERDLASVEEQLETHPRLSWPANVPLEESVKIGYEGLIQKKRGLEAELAVA